MTDKTQKLCDGLNVTVIDKDELNKILQDRLDFGFDSIYFRYAIAINELAEFKEKYYRNDGTSFNKKYWADEEKRHFYNALEQLLNAHREGKEE
jgi:hypothetical protein